MQAVASKTIHKTVLTAITICVRFQLLNFLVLTKFLQHQNLIVSSIKQTMLLIQENLLQHDDI